VEEDMHHKLFNRTPLLVGDDCDHKRQQIREYFHNTFDRYESLFQVLSCDEAYYIRPITLRHLLIFYLAHTATFFINKLILAGLIDKRINPRFESMFAVGVDEMSWDDLDSTHYDWPSVDAVRTYRDSVRIVVDQVIRNAPLTLPIDWKNPWWTILMGIEHERIHLETSSVLIRQHKLEYIKPHPAWEPCRRSGPAPQNEMVDVPAGSVNLGKGKSDTTYGWDNEYGRHQADVPFFHASRYLVSNREFLEFVDAGGYDNDEVWEGEGRAWKDFAHAVHPTFWIKGGEGWRLRLMAEEVAMPWDWPVEVNYHEAKAFCNWKKSTTGLTVRLPTEDEWYRLYDLAGLSTIPDNKQAEANITWTTMHLPARSPNSARESSTM